jgi:hypothetical protein
VSTLPTLREEPTIDRRPPGSPGASSDLPPWVRGALWFGLFAVTMYVLAWLVGGLVRPGYDPRAQAISELFELGAPWSSRGPLVVGLVLSGLAFLVLAPALDRAMPGSGRLGPVLVLVAGLGTLGVVAAPCTPGCPGAATSSFDLWHTITAGGGYTALVLAPLAFAWRVRGHEPALARWSVLLGGTAGLLFLVHVLGLLPGAPGLLQRLFNTIADAWYVVVAVWLLRRDRLARRQAVLDDHRAARRAR